MTVLFWSCYNNSVWCDQFTFREIQFICSSSSSSSIANNKANISHSGNCIIWNSYNQSQAQF